MSEDVAALSTRRPPSFCRVQRTILTLDVTSAADCFRDDLGCVAEIVLPLFFLSARAA